MRDIKGRFLKGHKGYGGGRKEGYNHSEYTRLKMSRTRKGRKFSQAHKDSISKALKGKVNMGENNPNWKGDNAGHRALHEWLVNHNPKPDRCQKCGSKGELELANMTGIYTRNIKDYKWLCITCHREYDGQTARIIESGKPTRFKEV